MSFLWNGNNLDTSRKISMRPSPMQEDDAENSAHYVCSLKRISLFISKLRWVKGSMTVEAAVVLPLFLFFFLSLGTAIEMIRLQNNMDFALCDVGRRLSVYGYALDGTGRSEEIRKNAEPGEAEWLSELKDIAFSYTYIKKELVDYLGKEYLEASCIVDGVSGIHFLESEIFGEEDCFEIIATYRVAPFGELVGVRGFRMANRYYGHMWNGYEIPLEESKTERDIVYVTEYGRVYHEDEMCSHLFLNVRQVGLQEAYESRNSNGAKYKLCEYCEKFDVNGMVYITEDGNRIHYRRDCAGLKRTIYTISRKASEGYAPCSRCAKK